MSTDALARPILKRLHAALKPHGYRKSGATFTSAGEDVSRIVNLQRSQASSSTELVVTVNLGAYSHVLAAMLGSEIARPREYDCHWRQRIGTLLPQRKDSWWRVHSVEEAESVGDEVAGAVVAYGLPALAAVDSTEKLRALWEAGRAPGLTEFLRQKYSSALGGSATPG